MFNFIQQQAEQYRQQCYAIRAKHALLNGEHMVQEVICHTLKYSRLKNEMEFIFQTQVLERITKAWLSKINRIIKGTYKPFDIGGYTALNEHVINRPRDINEYIFKTQTMKNPTIINFTRKCLKEGLAKCTPDQQMVFKRMYSHKNLEADINTVVDNMPVEKLDWALTQVEKILSK